MSADSYSLCPKCKTLLDEHEDHNEATLREDYEFYLKGPILLIEYGCSCNRCGFKYGFREEKNVLSGHTTD